MVGDVHGCFHTLERALEELIFTPRHDRLFAVGDLVNRGPNSHLALSWLTERITCSVLGNHEMALLGSLRRRRMGLRSKVPNAWHGRIPDDEVAGWIAALAKLPIMATVETPRGAVGIIHAEPLAKDWNENLRRTQASDPETIEVAVFGRDDTGANERERRGTRVGAIADLVHGHWPVERVTHLSNRWNLDTGAGFEAMNQLSIARIDEDPVRTWTFEVKE